MSAVTKGSAGRYLDNCYYREDDEQTLIQTQGIKNLGLKTLNRFI
jgi:hypothetical protein